MNAYHVLNVHASGDIAVNVSCIINAVYVIKKISHTTAVTKR